MATTWDELLERNKKYAETEHKPQPYLSEGPPLPPFIIFSCIDIRVSVERFLSIQPEEAFIVRNAGGRVKNSINDLLFLDTFTQGKGFTTVIVIHHTDCGYTHNTDEGIKDGLKARVPHHAHEIDQLEFNCIGSPEKLEESVREDLRYLKTHPLVRRDLADNAKGYVWDIKTGKLSPIGYEG